MRRNVSSVESLFGAIIVFDLLGHSQSRTPFRALPTCLPKKKTVLCRSSTTFRHALRNGRLQFLPVTIMHTTYHRRSGHPSLPTPLAHFTCTKCPCLWSCERHRTESRQNRTVLSARSFHLATLKRVPCEWYTRRCFRTETSAESPTQ